MDDWAKWGEIPRSRRGRIMDDGCIISAVFCFVFCFLPIHSGHQVRWTYQPGLRRVILFIFSERAVWGWGGGGYAARLFLLFSFPCSADHERDWPPCKVVFSGWQPIR